MGIVAVGVVRESRKFSGHPHVGRMRGHLCDSTAFLFSHFFCIVWLRWHCLFVCLSVCLFCLLANKSVHYSLTVCGTRTELNKRPNVNTSDFEQSHYASGIVFSYTLSNLVQLEIVPFDPPTPKILPYRTKTWNESDDPLRRYCCSKVSEWEVGRRSLVVGRCHDTLSQKNVPLCYLM